MTIAALARPEIRRLVAYKTADIRDFKVKLHANEAPLALATNSAEGLNRYPALRASVLAGKMADFYGVSADNILVTRGSSEGIDLLIRAFCCAERDDILLTPPAFEMYQVYASIQGAGTVSVPLQADNDFAVDVEALLGACTENTKLIFLCSPNNPTGTVIPQNQILQILEARAEKSIVVVDEAYIEYSNADSLVSLLSRYDNLVVLRTLSKALALAGARCGAVVAAPEMIRLLDSVLAPYALSSPVIASVELALSEEQVAQADISISNIVTERDRLRDALAACDAVEKIWPSQANFLLVRFKTTDKIKRCLEDASIAIRTYDNDPLLRDCARITVALASDNNRLIDAIRELPQRC